MYQSEDTALAMQAWGDARSRPRLALMFAGPSHGLPVCAGLTAPPRAICGPQLSPRPRARHELGISALKKGTHPVTVGDLQQLSLADIKLAIEAPSLGHAEPCLAHDHSPCEARPLVPWRWLHNTISNPAEEQFSLNPAQPVIPTSRDVSPYLCVPHLYAQNLPLACLLVATYPGLCRSQTECIFYVHFKNDLDLITMALMEMVPWHACTSSYHCCRMRMHWAPLPSTRCPHPHLPLAS